jgi:ribosomal protein S19
MKRYESKYNPAVKDISDYIHKHLRDGLIHPDMVTKITRVLDGVKITDNLLVQKDTELQTTKKILLDKEQKEWVKVLHQRYPDDYPVNFNEWSNNSWGKDVVNRKDLQAIEKHLPTFKADVLKNKFIEVLHQRFPHYYSARFEDWPNIWGKQVINRGDVEAMEKWIPIYEKEIKENLKQSFLSEKTAKENEIIKLAVKEQETLELKEQLRLKKLETQNKDQLLLAKELEKQELARLKEIEKEELLAQKEVELANKSFVKNRVIGELQEDIGLKEKETLNLKIESLMKQVEFHKKELEFKDKALEDAHELVKQNKIINELQEKLLAFKDLSKHDETLKLELSVIHFKVEESIVNGNVDEMKELSKYLSQLMKESIEKEESLDISELLNNLSPVHVQENLVQNPLSVINNFDINNVHTTHSVLISGEESSFDII